jgi:hypothetical protein
LEKHKDLEKKERKTWKSKKTWGKRKKDLGKIYKKMCEKDLVENVCKKGKCGDLVVYYSATKNTQEMCEKRLGTKCVKKG